MSLIRSSCSATHTKAPISPTKRVPIVCVELRSATGAGSAEPNTACRAKGRCLAGSHNDWEAIRYRRPPTWRSNMFIHSSSHIPGLLASKTRKRRHYSPLGVDPTPQKCESRARRLACRQECHDKNVGPTGELQSSALSEFRTL